MFFVGSNTKQGIQQLLPILLWTTLAVIPCLSSAMEDPSYTEMKLLSPSSMPQGAREESPSPGPPSEEYFLNRLCREGKVEEARTYLEALKENNQGEIPDKLLQTAGVFNYTALHESAFEGHFDVIQMLLGYDQYVTLDNGYVNVKTNNGYSALHLAAARGHTKVAKFLIEQGAELNCKDEFGKTPLESSETAAKFETLRVMFSAGEVTIILNY